MTCFSPPDFLDSPYFVSEPGNWHLKPGAPAKVRREFNRFMKALNEPMVIFEPVILKELELTDD